MNIFDIGKKFRKIIDKSEKGKYEKYSKITYSQLIKMIQSVQDSKVQAELMEELESRNNSLNEAGIELQSNADSVSKKIQQDSDRINAANNEAMKSFSQGLQSCANDKFSNAQQGFNKGDEPFNRAIANSSTHLKSEIDRMLGSDATDPDLDRQVEELINPQGKCL